MGSAESEEGLTLTHNQFVVLVAVPLSSFLLCLLLMIFAPNATRNFLCCCCAGPLP